MQALLQGGMASHATWGKTVLLVLPTPRCSTLTWISLICVSQNPLQKLQLLLPASSACLRTHCRNRSCFSLPHPCVPEPTAGTQFLPPPLRVPEPLQELQLLFPTSSTVLEPTAGTQLLSPSPHIPEPLQEPQLLLPYSSQLFLVSAQVPVVQCDSFGKI